MPGQTFLAQARVPLGPGWNHRHDLHAVPDDGAYDPQGASMCTTKRRAVAVTDEVVRILETIVMLLLVILAGLFVRKIKLLDQRTTAKLSTFVVDVAFPALEVDSAAGVAAGR